MGSHRTCKLRAGERSAGGPQPGIYRPRHPERTALYQALERDFEDYERIHPDRYEGHSGPLRPVVRTSVEAYLDCGRLHGGFARIRCPRCRAEHLLAFSCRTRGLCPSCQAKRSAVFAEWLVGEVLLGVPHRHVVFTIPKALRGLIERERRLHGLMARAAWEVLRDVLREAGCEPDGVPGVVASLQTFGSFGANFHPHLHALVTEGVITPDGRFHPVIWPGQRQREERFRRRFLARLRRAKRLSPSFHETLLAWRRSGFSVDARQRVGVGEEKRLERLARYATRTTLAVGAVREQGDGRIAVDTPPDPRTGATVKVLDRLDFVHAVCQQIPDRGLHQVRYYGAYANRKRRVIREAFEARGEEAPEASSSREDVGDASPSPPAPPGSVEAARRSAWARMLRKVFEVEPLVCPRCRVEMEIVASITEVGVIDRILKHRRERGLVSPFEPRAPPAA